MLLAALSASALLLLLAAKDARAEIIFTVNSTADTNDGSCQEPTSRFPDADCTLREAIEAANNASGADLINFTISGSGVKTISPSRSLPTITDQVTIDGYTQGTIGTPQDTLVDAKVNTLAKGTNAKLLIELDGTSVPASTGLKIRASKSVVKGLVINRFGEGIRISSGTRNHIEGNFIGTDPTGTIDRSNNRSGIAVLGGTSNRIGSTTRGARNLISGNGDDGVLVQNEVTTDTKMAGQPHRHQGQRDRPPPQRRQWRVGLGLLGQRGGW